MKRIYLLIAIFALSLICCLTACAGLENGKNNDDITPLIRSKSPIIVGPLQKNKVAVKMIQ